ncbi:645_t:CDS:1 [Scutellospora calospora]|uniref:645_t:CDS:1 n=1 Tax=Scutellospora calospora TaxID=85575 RepID=A0ACA9KHX9_9GLOM|nr:645_t:CDS:1 [Scutellospora calospora]
MNIQTLENIAKVYRFNISQLELEPKHTENKELTINDIYLLVNSLFDNIEKEDNNLQDNKIDQSTILDSINSTTENLELKINIFVDFNSQIFESFNSTKNNFIADKNFEIMIQKILMIMIQKLFFKI